MHGVLGFSLVSVWTLIGVDTAATIFLAMVIWVNRRHWALLLAGSASGAAAGLLLTWWFGDQQGILGIPPTPVDRAWAVAAFVGLGLSVVAFTRRNWIIRVGAVVAAISFLVSGGLGINRDGGLFPKISDVVGVSSIRPLNLPLLAGSGPAHSFDASLYTSWVAPAGMPSAGKYGTVAIPGATSGFRARPAIVYLPPAALTGSPPALPVLIVMSGQGPGAAPYNVVDAGHFVSTLDRIAQAHHGLAPIVVIPDQLRSPTNNPMCVNGALGNSDTYLTVDVPRWVRSHLLVQTGAQAWAVGGFSEGGTCALQLATRHPNLFGSFIDVSGQRGPELGSIPSTIQRGFGGSVAKYLAAQPLNIMKQHGHYANSSAFIATGANDVRYRRVVPAISAPLKAAGVHVTTYMIPAVGHDWAAAARGLAHGTSWLMPRIGLAQPVGER